MRGWAWCFGFVQCGEHGWSVVSTGFAGDEPILVRHATVVRNARTGAVIGDAPVKGG